MQTAPPFRILAATAPSIAASMSASAKTTKGAQPPSSAETRMTCSALRVIRWRPTASEPVKVSFLMRPSDSSGSVASSSDDTTMLSTPAGSPASIRICPRASADSGVSGEGRRTTVHPAAIAGAIPRAGTASGKFHGLMTRHGPTGARVTRWALIPSGATCARPEIRAASSENHSR